MTENKHTKIEFREPNFSKLNKWLTCDHEWEYHISQKADPKQIGMKNRGTKKCTKCGKVEII